VADPSDDGDGGQSQGQTTERQNAVEQVMRDTDDRALIAKALGDQAEFARLKRLGQMQRTLQRNYSR
jgi:hypothetical protein